MKGINLNDKIFIAGHRGLVGSAILEVLKERGYKNILTRARDELDLLDQNAVSNYMQSEKPDVVFIAAAKVGGIHANNTYRADFIAENLQIQNNVILNAKRADVRKLVFLGSSCIYPRNCSQPMKEEYLLTGELEYTNRPYAIAKIAGLEMVNTIRQQYGKDWFSVMPTNLYGPGDNFHPENSHVLPALIRRFEEAKRSNAKSVIIWGTGVPKREFMYSTDCANAIVSLAEHPSLQETFDNRFGGQWSHINVGIGEDISIAALSEAIATTVGFRGDLRFDTTKPDGTPRKLQSVDLMKSLIDIKCTPLSTGLANTLEYFKSIEIH